MGYFYINTSYSLTVKIRNTITDQRKAGQSNMGRKCTTDFDEIRSHTNEIINIWESTGRMVFYEIDKDWFYREEEVRWITMNDNGGWRKMSIHEGELVKEEMPLA